MVGRRGRNSASVPPVRVLATLATALSCRTTSPPIPTCSTPAALEATAAPPRRSTITRRWRSIFRAPRRALRGGLLLTRLGRAVEAQACFSESGHPRCGGPPNYNVRKVQADLIANRREGVAGLTLLWRLTFLSHCGESFIGTSNPSHPKIIELLVSFVPTFVQRVLARGTNSETTLGSCSRRPNLV